MFERAILGDEFRRILGLIEEQIVLGSHSFCPMRPFSKLGAISGIVLP